MRAASVTAKSDKDSVYRLTNNVTFTKLINEIIEDVNDDKKDNSQNSSNTSSRKLSLKNTAMCLLSILRKKDQPNTSCQSANVTNSTPPTPPIMNATPRKTSDTEGGKSKKDSKNSKEYKIYNKRRYVVRQGKLGGKYIQVGDKKVYV